MLSFIHQLEKVSNIQNEDLNGQKNDVVIRCIIILLFLANPLLGLFILYVQILLDRKDNYFYIKLLCLFSAVFIGCINSTKIPENDLLMYEGLYDNAKDTPFLLYITMLSGGKEPLYLIINYVLYWILNGSFSLFVLVLSTIMYILLTSSVYLFGKALNLNKPVIATLIIIMCFTPYIFVLSAHLLRQFFAASILIYVLVQWAFYKKREWLLTIGMIFIHSSTVLFLPFLFFSFFQKAFSFKTIPYYIMAIIALASVQLIAQFMLDLIPSGIFKYVLTRASKDTTFDAEVLSFSKILTTVMTAAIPLIIVYFLNKKLKENKGVILFVNLLTILTVFILMNLHQTELSLRYNFYMWIFFPFSMAFVFKILRHYNFQCIICSGSLLLFFFYYIFNMSEWTYQVSYNIFLYPLILYII